jgi:hypothetical protein
MDDLHRCATLYLIFPLLGSGKLDFGFLFYSFCTFFLLFSGFARSDLKSQQILIGKKIPLNRCIKIVPE